MTRRLLIDLVAVAALVVAALVAIFAYQALKAPLATPPNTNLPPENCSPGPCANVNGYTLWVSNVQIQNTLIRMTLTFQNSSTATHASPEDVTLIDSSRHTSGLVTGPANCNTFTRHEFSNGELFGPIAVCFRVINATPPFTLRWTPDLGPFCCETAITINRT